MTPTIGSAEVAKLLRSILTNDAVPEPVGSGRDGNALGANGKLEDLADDDPACGTPGTIGLSIKPKNDSFSVC